MEQFRIYRSLSASHAAGLLRRLIHGASALVEGRRGPQCQSTRVACPARRTQQHSSPSVAVVRGSLESVENKIVQVTTRRRRPATGFVDGWVAPLAYPATLARARGSLRRAVRSRAPFITFAHALALPLLFACVACGPATYNVRASRAYANEEADQAVIADRLVDLARAAELAEELLLEAAYTPGDRWVSALRLDDDQGDAIRERFEDAPPYAGRYEVPLMKVYRVRIEEARRLARPGAGRYRGLLEAAAALAPDARALPAFWRAMLLAKEGLTAAELRIEALSAGRPPGAPDTTELAAARAEAALLGQALAVAQAGIQRAAAAIRAAPAQTAAEAQAARDLVDAVSFLLRLHIEALAVAPYVVKQARRLARSEPGYRPNVERARALSSLLEEERAGLELLAEALTGPSRVPLSEAAGFALHEGLLSQAAAINLDATHLQVRGDTELLFFNAIASAGASGGRNDYTGRTRRLSYDVDPVLMVGARVMATYDFAHVRNAATLGAGYKTNRLFSQGGDVQYDNSLGGLLGLDGLASDFVDIGADLLGVNTSVKIATFTSGEVSEIVVDPATDRDQGVLRRAPLQIRFHQVDVGLDLTKFFPEEAEDLYAESFQLGFRYMDYELPRIFYVLSQPRPGEDSVYVLDRQSPAQSVRSVFYQGGFTLRLGNGEWPRLSPFADLGLYGGAGPVSYHLIQGGPESGGPREDHDGTMIAVTGNASLGLRLRLTSYRSRPRAVLELSYNAQLVGQGMISSIRGIRRGDETSYVVDKKIDIGGFDLFHGPRLLGKVVF